MATRVFVPPDFNQWGLIWNPFRAGVAAHTLNVRMQVWNPSRAWFNTNFDSGSTLQLYTIIKLPAGTVVFGGRSDGTASLVRCPDGSDTVYRVELVWDVAQNFLNEYRAACCYRLSDLPGQYGREWPGLPEKA